MGEVLGEPCESSVHDIRADDLSSEPNRYHEAGDNQDAAQEEGNNDRQSAKSATQPSHLSPTVFALPNLPIAGQSASSLMDAVFGDHVKSSAPHTSQPNPQPSGGIPYTSTHSIARPPILFKRKSKRDASGASSTRTASGTETESWDVLSDAGSRMNEDAGQGEMRDGVVELKKRDEVVDELQKKVDRR